MEGCAQNDADASLASFGRSGAVVRRVKFKMLANDGAISWNERCVCVVKIDRMIAG